MASTEQLKNAERIIQLTEDREKVSQKIKDIIKEMNSATKEEKENLEKRLRTQKVILDTANKEIKIANGLKDISDDILDNKDKEAALSYDIAGSKEKLRKLSIDIKKLEDIGTTSAKKKAEALKDQRDETYVIFEANADIAAQMQSQNKLTDKLLGSLGLSASSMKDIKDQAVLFGRAIAKNPYLLLLAGLAMAVAYTVDMVKNTQKLSQEFGLSASQAAKVNKEVGFFNRKFFEFFGQDTNKISGEIIQNFGDIGNFAGLSAEEVAKMSMGLGIAGEDAVKLARSMIGIVDGVNDGADGMERLEMFSGIAKANNVGTGQIIKDLAENTETFAEFTRDGGTNMARAAVQARKLGVSLQTTAKIANSLLDFESSIEKEMEASLMIGKQLNFNRARELALAGDIAGATQDVVRQIGGAGELQKMNVLQRRALAESIGVSVDELSRLASGKLEVKSDGVEPIDANTEATLLLNDTIDGLRNNIAMMSPALLAIEPVANALRGMANKIPGVDLGPSRTSQVADDLIKKTPGGRFKVDGTKGPGFKDQSKALSQADELLKSSAVKNSAKILKKAALPVAMVLDAVDVGSTVMDENKTKGDVARQVTEKAAGYGTAALGAKGGAALGAAIGSVIPVLGTAVGAGIGGLIGGVGGYFLGEEVAGTALDSTMGIATGAEKDKGMSKLLEEYSDLDKEERQQLADALLGGQEGINKFIEANSGLFSGFTDLGELVQVMQEVAANTGKTTTEIANLISE